MKTCFKCKLPKQLLEFGVRKDTGRPTSYCNECEAKRSRDAHAANPTAKRASKLKWEKNNPDKSKQSKLNWETANPEYKTDWERNRYQKNPEFRISRCLRARLRSSLKGLGLRRSAKTVELLGAPWVWVEAYLEEQFVPGMTWENHGPVWHIDHIRPISSFDLTDPEQQKICFHWTNLQPLFALDNLRKSDTYDPQNA